MKVSDYLRSRLPLVFSFKDHLALICNRVARCCLEPLNKSKTLEKMNLYRKAVRKINKELDVSNYITKMRNIDIITRIVLNHN